MTNLSDAWDLFLSHATPDKPSDASPVGTLSDDAAGTRPVDPRSRIAAAASWSRMRRKVSDNLRLRRDMRGRAALSRLRLAARSTTGRSAFYEKG